MKNYLIILLALILTSCDVFEEKKGTLKITATYGKISYPSPTYQVYPDNGAVIYVFNDVNILTSDLKFDGKGNLGNSSKTIKYDQSITLNNDGKGELILNRGTYAVACVSGNDIKNGNKRWLLSSINIDTESKELKFKFEEL